MTIRNRSSSRPIATGNKLENKGQAVTMRSPERVKREKADQKAANSKSKFASHGLTGAFDSVKKSGKSLVIMPTQQPSNPSGAGGEGTEGKEGSTENSYPWIAAEKVVNTSPSATSSEDGCAPVQYSHHPEIFRPHKSRDIEKFDQDSAEMQSKELSNGGGSWVLDVKRALGQGVSAQVEAVRSVFRDKPRKQAAVAEQTLQAKYSCEWKETARRKCEELDENKDGYLSRNQVEDLMEHMKNSGYAAGDLESTGLTEGLGAIADKDEEGKIHFEDFLGATAKSLQQPANFISMQFKNLSEAARHLVLEERQRVERNVRGKSRWLVDPMGCMHGVWDFLVTFGSVLLIFSLPVSLGWAEFLSFTFLINALLEVLFFTDVILNFFTGYIDEDGVVVMDRKSVIWRYLRGYFLVDLLSGLPYDIFFKMMRLMSLSIPLSTARVLLKSLKVLRLFKLFTTQRDNSLLRCATRLANGVERMTGWRVPRVVSKLTWLAFLTVVLSHWMGSLQFMVVRFYDFPDESWVVVSGLKEKTPDAQWCWAFFKALSQLILIGFETPPFTNVSCTKVSPWCEREHWITLCCLYVGALYYSYMISSMLTLIQSTSFANHAFEEKLAQLEEFMREKKLPIDLQMKIREQLRMNFSHRLLFREEDLFRLLASQDVDTIKREGARHIVNTVPLLSENQSFAMSLSRVMERVVFGPNTVVFEQDEVGDAVYFLFSGVVVVSTKDINAKLSLNAGSFFGEVSLLYRIRRTLTVQTDTKCTVYRVDKTSFIDILTEYPDVTQRLLRAAKRRLQLSRHMKNPAGCPLESAELDPEDSMTKEVKGNDAKKFQASQSVEKDEED